MGRKALQHHTNSDYSCQISYPPASLRREKTVPETKWYGLFDELSGTQLYSELKKGNRKGLSHGFGSVRQASTSALATDSTKYPGVLRGGGSCGDNISPGAPALSGG
jgi:hypothetical protein